MNAKKKGALTGWKELWQLIYSLNNKELLCWSGELAKATRERSRLAWISSPRVTPTIGIHYAPDPLPFIPLFLFFFFPRGKQLTTILIRRHLKVESTESYSFFLIVSNRIDKVFELLLQWLSFKCDVLKWDVQSQALSAREKSFDFKFTRDVNTKRNLEETGR